jgi:hypothetical protein
MGKLKHLQINRWAPSPSLDIDSRRSPHDLTLNLTNGLPVQCILRHGKMIPLDTGIYPGMISLSGLNTRIAIWSCFDNQEGIFWEGGR